MKPVKVLLFTSVLMVVLTVVGFFAVAADSELSSRIYRNISMGVLYSGFKVEPGESIESEVLFINQGKIGEDVKVWIDKLPKEWNAIIQSDVLMQVTGIYVPPKSEKKLIFKAIPKGEIKPGKYSFIISAKTSDGRFWMKKTVTVDVMKKETNEKTSGKILIDTFYPVLKGPVSGRFEYTIMVKNGLGKDAIFNLYSEGPDGWIINFKPELKSTYISSLRILANQSKTLDIEVHPVSTAAAGEYPIKIGIRTKETGAEAKLKVILTGSYSLKVGTASGLLSVNARPGKPSNVSIYVKNSGTAENRDISFSSFKPENWKVEFKPEKISVLKPNQVKQVEVIITPYGEALVGDYSIEVQARGQKGSKDSVEFRVTVKASPIWGWAGIFIIAIMITGLILTFKFFGRR